MFCLPIRIAGGITNSQVWLQMFADIFQKPLELVNVKENGAMGAAMAAGVMSGLFTDFKAAAKVWFIFQEQLLLILNWQRFIRKNMTCIKK